jgi:cytochrome P450
LTNLIPLNVSHALSREIEVEGYTLPAGTAILPNIGLFTKHCTAIEDLRQERLK